MGIELSEEEKKWKGIIEGRPSTGLSITRYCESLGVKENEYYWWQQKLRGKEVLPRKAEPIRREKKFVAVSLPATTGISKEWSVELQLGSGTIVRVR